MPKSYWIARVSIHNKEGYPEYLAAANVAFKKYDARFVVRGGSALTVEGASRERNVVVEFRDHATAMACYHSPEYQKARLIRQQIAEADVIIVEGVAD